MFTSVVCHITYHLTRWWWNKMDVHLLSFIIVSVTWMNCRRPVVLSRGRCTNACGAAAAAGFTHRTTCSRTSAHSISRMFSSPDHVSRTSPTGSCCRMHLHTLKTADFYVKQGWWVGSRVCPLATMPVFVLRPPNQSWWTNMLWNICPPNSCQKK